MPAGGRQQQLILGQPRRLLELFKEGHAGLGTLQGELQGSREDGEGGLASCPFTTGHPPASGTKLEAGLEGKGTRLVRPKQVSRVVQGPGLGGDQ